MPNTRKHRRRPNRGSSTITGYPPALLAVALCTETDARDLLVTEDGHVLVIE